MELAMKSSWFRSSRFKKGRRGGDNRERPGLGSGESGGGGKSSDYLDSSHVAAATSGRLSTMKQAYKSSYLSKFQRASEPEGVTGRGGVTASVSEQAMPPPLPAGVSAPMAQQRQQQQQEDATGDSSSRKRKSRWE